jgi:membrane-bound lytic murein transglycosylase D
MWQFIAPTGKRFGLRINAWTDERRDIVKATDAALDYLTVLHREFKGDWGKAIAAYNVGERRIHREVARNRAAGKPTSFSALRLPRETRRYVPQLVALRNIINDPQRFGVTLEPLSARVDYQPVRVDGALDMSIASALSGVPLPLLRLLNPGHKRRATQGDIAHALLLPKRGALRLATALTDLDDEARTIVERHVVQPGDTLSKLAKTYRVKVESIVLDNNPDRKNRWLYAGETVTVNVSSQPFVQLAKDGPKLLASLRKSLI